MLHVVIECVFETLELVGAGVADVHCFDVGGTEAGWEEEIRVFRFAGVRILHPFSAFGSERDVVEDISLGSRH